MTTMMVLCFLLELSLLINSMVMINAQWRSLPKRITAESGSDLSLSCTFYHIDSDETIVQWLYQNRTENHHHHRKSKTHWRALFLNAQSLTPKETRYSIQQKIQESNQTSVAFSTILTLAKITQADEGLYMCKSLSPKTIQMTYLLRVIESLEVSPKEILIPTKEINLYSLRLNCILTDHQVNRRHHEIFWWHNNRRLGSQTNRNIRIMQNLTGHSLISTLLYTGEPSTLVGNYICESEPLRRSLSVVLQSNQSSNLWNDWSTILTLWIGIWLFVS